MPSVFVRQRVQLTRPKIAAAVDALALRALEELQSSNLPPLYSSGVRYKRERPKREDWRTPREILHYGNGDCEDLSAWRIAELRKAGEKAKAYVTNPRPNLWHIQVLREDGRIEDPSRRLGMGAP